MNSAAKKKRAEDIDDVVYPPEYLILGEDIDEVEAANLNVPSRIGFNGDAFIWLDDLDPK